MGALHRGHAALIEFAREVAGPGGSVAVSIFVNPIQFDRPADLQNYPSTIEADLETCRSLGVDLVFNPSAAVMYASNRSVTVGESALSKTLCGATRPGHFDGVCTVVLKLFNLIQPDAAVFGEKDYQQLAILRRMVRDLNSPVEIESLPTVREGSGLALSSRNVRLTESQRTDAPRIFKALSDAAKLNDRQQILAVARSGIESPLNQIDYLELVDAESLEPVADLSCPALLATAVLYGDIRLIDSVLIPAAPEGR